MVLQRRLGHVGLEDVGELDIADRTWRLRDPGGDGSVARGALTDRPGDGLTFADLALPVTADRREVVGEDVGRSAAVGPVHNGDRLVGQADTAVVRGEGRIVPILDRSEEDAGDGLGRELQLPVGYARQVVGQRLGAQGRCDLDDGVTTAGSGELRRVHRHIARTEVDELLGQLLDPGPRADRLVVDGHLAELQVVGKARGVVERAWERRAGAGQRGCRRGDCDRTTGGRIVGNASASAGGEQDGRAHREGDKNAFHAGDISSFGMCEISADWIRSDPIHRP